MTQQDRNDIKGITVPMIWTFVTGTIAVCATVIGGVGHIERTFSNHEIRITELEKKTDKIESTFITQNLKRNK